MVHIEMLPFLIRISHHPIHRLLVTNRHAQVFVYSLHDQFTEFKRCIALSQPIFDGEDISNMGKVIHIVLVASVSISKPLLILDFIDGQHTLW